MSHLAPHDEDADPLDDLIRRSVRGDVDRLALDRLEQRWHAAMGEQQRVFPMWTLAAAACLAILAGTLGLFVLWPDKEVVEGNKPEDGVTSGRVVAMDNGPPDDQTQVTDSSPPGRDLSPELTPYERLLVQKAFQQLPATTTESSRLLRRELVRSLAALETVDDESSARLAERLGISAAELQRDVGELCFVLRGPNQRKAVELFAQSSTTESLPVLLKLYGNSAHQDRVAPAIARLAPMPVLSGCYLQAASSQARSVLAARLIEKFSPQDVGVLLELVMRSQQPDELLLALRKANAKLAEALLAGLDAEHRGVRFAAARSLGAIGRFEITRRLIDRVVQNRSRQEALVALAASDEPLAVQFVAQARKHSVLAAALQSALVQIGTVQPWYGG